MRQVTRIHPIKKLSGIDNADTREAPRERKDERIEMSGGALNLLASHQVDENAGSLNWPDCSAFLFVRSTEHGSAGPQPAADAQRWSPPTYFTCRCFNDPHEGGLVG
jgi:hypothetical protein